MPLWEGQGETLVTVHLGTSFTNYMFVSLGVSEGVYWILQFTDDRTKAPPSYSPRLTPWGMTHSAFHLVPFQNPSRKSPRGRKNPHLRTDGCFFGFLSQDKNSSLPSKMKPPREKREITPTPRWNSSSIFSACHCCKRDSCCYHRQKEKVEEKNTIPQSFTILSQEFSYNVSPCHWEIFPVTLFWKFLKRAGRWEFTPTAGSRARKHDSWKSC